MPLRHVSLRRALAARGLATATAAPPASQGRTEDATHQLARLVETVPPFARPVGGVVPCPVPMAFLDGVQHAEIVAYAGASPLMVAEVAAAVRLREDGRFRTVEVERRTLVIARAETLAAAGAALEGLDTVAIAPDSPPHPVRDGEFARAAADRARGALEVMVGERFRAAHAHWLVVDGSLTESPSWATDTRMIGVAKSHAALPFEGEQLEDYLRLPAGHRSPVFAPESRRVAPVYAWGLRLRAWEGRDLLHGLIRVEAAATASTLAAADEISRWLLAERAPLSTPDPRWDRLLYGVRLVERHLKA